MRSMLSRLNGRHGGTTGMECVGEPITTPDSRSHNPNTRIECPDAIATHCFPSIENEIGLALI
jgi:hypothetical protein